MFMMISWYGLLGFLILKCVTEYHNESKFTHIVPMAIIIVALIAMVFQYAALGTSLFEYKTAIILLSILFTAFFVASVMLRDKTERMRVYDKIYEKLYIGLVSVAITFAVIDFISIADMVIIKQS